MVFEPRRGALASRTPLDAEVHWMPMTCPSRRIAMGSKSEGWDKSSSGDHRSFKNSHLIISRAISSIKEKRQVKSEKLNDHPGPQRIQWSCDSNHMPSALGLDLFLSPPTRHHKTGWDLGSKVVHFWLVLGLAPTTLTIQNSWYLANTSDPGDTLFREFQVSLTGTEIISSELCFCPSCRLYGVQLVQSRDSHGIHHRFRSVHSHQ